MSAGLSQIDLQNMSLSHLGMSQQVVTLGDQNNWTAVTTFWYPKCRDELLQSAPWYFADTYAPLTQETPVPSPTGPTLGYAAPGWQYSYIYPTDCLQPINVTTLAGARFGPQLWNGYWWPQMGMTLSIPKIPFKVEESTINPGSLCILCDFLATSQSPLYLFYIQAITSTAQFDPMFCAALAYLIGWRAGGALRADKDKITYCEQQYKQARLEAMAQHQNAMQQDRERDSPSVQARW